MDLRIPDIASEMAIVTERAILDGGGFDLVRRCITQPNLREKQAKLIISSLGIEDLDVRSGPDALIAGAEVCRVAGSLAFPYPVVALLARPPSMNARFLAVVDRQSPWAEHADLEGPWLVVDLDGIGSWAQRVGMRTDRSIGPFVERLQLAEQVSPPGVWDMELVMVLDCCRILGALETAHSLALDHVRSRRQFDRALSKFQGVQFHIADSAVALRGLRQLTRYTLWRLAQKEGAMVDVLALRSYAIEAANKILWISQLLHGAIGFCDEHDLSLITRMIQAQLRLPADLARTTELLSAAIDQHGFDSLFAGS